MPAGYPRVRYAAALLRTRVLAILLLLPSAGVIAEPTAQAPAPITIEESASEVEQDQVNANHFSEISFCGTSGHTSESQVANFGVTSTFTTFETKKDAEFCFARVRDRNLRDRGPADWVVEEGIDNPQARLLAAMIPPDAANTISGFVWLEDAAQHTTIIFQIEEEWLVGEMTMRPIASN